MNEKKVYAEMLDEMKADFASRVATGKPVRGLPGYIGECYCALEKGLMLTHFDGVDGRAQDGRRIEVKTVWAGSKSAGINGCAKKRADAYWVLILNDAGDITEFLDVPTDEVHSKAVSSQGTVAMSKILKWRTAA